MSTDMKLVPPTAPATTMRLLTNEEWPRLFTLFADSFPGKPIPMPPGAACAVLEQDGEIKAAVFLTLVYHMEPHMARPGYGHDLPRLVELLETSVKEILSDGEPLTYYMTFPEHSHALETYVNELGAIPMTGMVPVMKTLGGETPEETAVKTE